jgi:hypothetical protein
MSENLLHRSVVFVFQVGCSCFLLLIWVVANASVYAAARTIWDAKP